MKLKQIITYIILDVLTLSMNDQIYYSFLIVYQLLESIFIFIFSILNAFLLIKYRNYNYYKISLFY